MPFGILISPAAVPSIYTISDIHLANNRASASIGMRVTSKVSDTITVDQVAFELSTEPYRIDVHVTESPREFCDKGDVTALSLKDHAISPTYTRSLSSEYKVISRNVDLTANLCIKYRIGMSAKEHYTYVPVILGIDRNGMLQSFSDNDETIPAKVIHDAILVNHEWSK